MTEIFVFLTILVGYGAAIAIGGWFVLRPEIRTQIQLNARTVASLFYTRLIERLSLLRWIGSIHSYLNNRRLFIGNALARYKVAVIITVTLITTPVIVVFWIQPKNGIEAFEDIAVPTDPVITALLQGEHLVPPPPLPPELFTTKEVEVLRPSLINASRDWIALDNDFKQRLLSVFQLMAQHGYQMALLEGYRSPQRQEFLATLGPHVTNAGAYQSYHQFGLAADSAFLRDGKIVISEKDPWAMEGYRLYGKYAEAAGLVWGGRWKLMDFGHVELRKPSLLRASPRKE